MSPQDLMPTRKLLDHLPPIDAAPILRHLARLGLEKFRQEYALATPLLPDGTVDHELLVSEMRHLVDPEYRWHAPFFDEHHLHWSSTLYGIDQHDGDAIPSRFRDLSTQKLWVPREFHNFIHAVTHEPAVPDRAVMRAHIDEYRRNRYLYLLTDEAISLSERDEKSEYIEEHDLYIYREGTNKRRFYKPGVLELRRQEFINMLERTFDNSPSLDHTSLHILELIEQQGIENQRTLYQIRRRLGDIAVCRSHKRAARAITLPIKPAFA